MPVAPVMAMTGLLLVLLLVLVVVVVEVVPVVAGWWGVDDPIPYLEQNGWIGQ